MKKEGFFYNNRMHLNPQVPYIIPPKKTTSKCTCISKNILSDPPRPMGNKNGSCALFLKDYSEGNLGIKLFH